MFVGFSWNSVRIVFQKTVEQVWVLWKSARWKPYVGASVDLYQHVPHLMCKKKPTHDAVVHLWVSGSQRPSISYGRKRNYIYACTVEPYVILKIKGCHDKTRLVRTWVHSLKYCFFLSLNKYVLGVTTKMASHFFCESEAWSAILRE
jgi:hypothetical protein